jgi:phosphopantothenoylcysteine decarboxylase/phosphopantothenate--cysteine ligase
LGNSRQVAEVKHWVNTLAEHVERYVYNVKVSGAGFQGDTNVLTLISGKSETELPLMSKWDAANRLLDEILKLR